MKRLVTLLIIIFMGISSVNTTYCLDSTIKTKIDSIYLLFTNKLTKKYNIADEIKILKNLDTKLRLVTVSKKISTNNKSILNYLLLINKKKLTSENILITKNKLTSEDKLNTEENITPVNIDNTATTNEKIFNQEYKNNLNNEINDYSISRSFKKILYNKDNIFLENGVWYYYKINDYNYFLEPDNITINDLNHNGIYTNSAVLFYLDTNNLGFAKDYEKIKLISDDIIYGITNKYNFLLEVKDDKKFLNYEYDQDFKSLKKLTLELTNGLNNSEKIKKIYNYILDNVSYTKIINFENKEIFSGIELYNNKEGVCEGYTKLFMFMLNFAGVGNTEIIRGHVINAPDFPDIGHAWVKVGDKYYDPTFDDPLGPTKTKTFEEYKYFALPYDLFYSNRFDYNKLPEYLKTKSLEYREAFIQNNLYNLASKYINNDYILLKKSKFKIKYGIGVNEKITLSNFDEITTLYKVNNNIFTQNGKKYFISKLYYFSLNDDKIEPILEQLDYNLSGYYFFKWIEPDGSYEYRLGYSLELQQQ